MRSQLASFACRLGAVVNLRLGLLALGVILAALALRPAEAQSFPDPSSFPKASSFREAAQDPCDWSWQSYDDFYVPPDLGDLTPDRLGELLRVEHITTYTQEDVADMADLPSSLYGGELYRVLYLSQSPLETAQAVSALVVVPTVGDPPPGGFPVIAWAHPTTGMADECAPSRSDPDHPSMDDVVAWVAQGYQVIATDYVGLGIPTDYMGLGTPGLHPYMVGDSAAYSLLDSARAALRFCDDAYGIVEPPAANQIFLAGHSQGGHAVLFAHQVWASYAPELGLLGTVTFAPAAEPKLLIENILLGDDFFDPVAPALLAMYAYSQYYSAPPNLQPWVQDPYATEIITKSEEACILALSLWLPRCEQVFHSDVLDAVEEGRWEDLEPFTTYLYQNTPLQFSPPLPALILQGVDDRDVPVEIGERLTERLCIQDSPAKLILYPDTGHLNITREARPDAVDWIKGRLDGWPAPDSCNELLDRRFLPAVYRNP